MQMPWRPPRELERGRTAPALWPPSAIACLLAAQVAGFVAQWIVRRLDAGADPFLGAGALSAEGLRAGHFWQPVTHLFLFNGPGWLLSVSLLALFAAGRPLEAVIGRRHLFQLWLLAGVVGGVGQVGLQEVEGVSASLTGALAPALAVCLAASCVLPEMSLTPWRRLKVKHVAIGAVTAAGALLVLDAHGRLTGSRSAEGVVGCLTGCLYMHRLGFGRRARPERVAAGASASPGPAVAVWSPQVQPGQPSSKVMTAPAAATGALVVPRFTERERRMSPREYVSEQVDPILDKISRHGIGSLSDDDRRVLEKGREKISQGGRV